MTTGEIQMSVSPVSVISKTNRKIKTLNLSQKIVMIEDYEINHLTPKDLAAKFGVGKTQVYQTLKKKEKIKSEWLRGRSGDVKRLRRTSPYDELNDAVYEWYISSKEKGMTITGPMVQAEALIVASELGKTDFKASNGWLDSFKTRHNISFKQDNGEVKITNTENRTINSETFGTHWLLEWKLELMGHVAGYEEENIFNGDAVGMFYRLLPTEIYLDKTGEDICHEKIVVFLVVNMKGEFEKPVVVGRNSRPRIFGNLNTADLAVHWSSNKNVTLTNAIVEDWLRMFDEKMKLENRRVCLFLNSATCQPQVFLSNVKIVFFPVYTSSITGPLNQGIFSDFKRFYRKSLLQSILPMEFISITELTQSINLLDAINWVDKARMNISPENVRKSFIKTGFPGVLLYQSVHNDSMDDITNLCHQLNIEVSADDVIHFDDYLAASEMTDTTVKEEDEEIDEGEEKEKILDIETYSDAVKALNDLVQFAAYKNCPRLLGLLQEAKEILCTSSLNSAIRQYDQNHLNEVDEETTEEQSTIERDSAKSERDLHARFQEFWRRNKHEDQSPTCLPSSPTAETEVEPNAEVDKPQTLPQITNSLSPTETTSKALSPTSTPQQSNRSHPLHMLAERNSPSRTSI